MDFKALFVKMELNIYTMYINHKTMFMQFTQTATKWCNEIFFFLDKAFLSKLRLVPV